MAVPLTVALCGALLIRAEQGLPEQTLEWRFGVELERWTGIESAAEILMMSRFPITMLPCLDVLLPQFRTLIADCQRRGAGQ